MKSKLKYLILNNWTISLAIFVPVFLFLHPTHEKFIIREINAETQRNDARIYFADLNNDGQSDRIEYFKNNAGKSAVKVYTPSNMGQSNSSTYFLQNSASILFADIDENGSEEIYFPGIRNDSIFINVTDYSNLNSSGLLRDPDELFLTEISDEKDFNFGFLNSADLDKDGNDELLLYINAGYSLQPRKIYAIKPLTKEVHFSPLLGSKLAIDFMEDIDHDGNVELVKGTFAFRNYENLEIPYTDTCSWIMVFNNDLTFKFPPVLASTEKSSTLCYPVFQNDSVYIFSISQTVNQLTNAFTYRILNMLGEIIKTSTLKPEEPQKIPWLPIGINTLQKGKKVFHLIDYTGNVFVLDNQFNLKHSHKIKDFNHLILDKVYDLDFDGNPEYILRSNNENQFAVLDSKLKHISYFKLSDNPRGISVLGIQVHAGKKTNLVYQINQELFYFSFKKNLLWNVRLVLWIGIYTLIFVFVWLIQYIQKERLKMQLQTKHQIRELQFKVITSQLNPHFTFNALTTISSSLYDSNNPEVYDRFTTFSRLIRTILADSDKIARSLKNEIDFTKDFLAIQRVRFNETFSYEFMVSKQVDLNVHVPKLCIQLFVENAIKHAFPNVPGKDKLEIRISCVNQNICIEIEDNGIGRKKAKENMRLQTQYSTGIGLKTIQEFVDLLNSRNSQKISFEISDVLKDQNNTGTLVKIIVPLKFSYSLN